MYQDAGDIFQAVCVDLLLEAARSCASTRALPKWLMQTCYHECLRHQQAAKREVELEPAAAEQLAAMRIPCRKRCWSQFAEEQTLRDVVSEMPERCAQMIHMLFFETAARPYEEIAKALGPGDRLHRIYSRPLS